MLLKLPLLWLRVPLLYFSWQPRRYRILRAQLMELEFNPNLPAAVGQILGTAEKEKGKAVEEY